MLVAVSLVVLLAMAALAIDVTVLYVAKTQLQNATDGAALAGAKALADSGVTFDPTQQPEAQSRAQGYASGFIGQATVMGQAPILVSSSFDFNTAGNPKVTVKLQAVVPTLFAKLFGRQMVTVQTSATAEAYSPQAMTGVPQAGAKCLKPWLVGNSNLPFTLGQHLTLQNGMSSACMAAQQCTLASGAYLPAQIVFGSQPPVVPADASTENDYVQAIAGCSELDWITPSGSPPKIDYSSNRVSDTIAGVEYLIGASGTGMSQGQDSVETDGGQPWPVWIRAGDNWPANLQRRYVSTSRSVVAIPVVNSSMPLGAGPVTIVSLLRGFVEQVDGNGVLTVRVLGLGVNPQPGWGQVSGNMGADAIAVRLIQP